MKTSSVKLFLISAIVALSVFINKSRRLSSVNLTPLMKFERTYEPEHLILNTNQSRQIIISAPVSFDEEVIYVLDHAEINLEYKKVVLKVFLKLFYAQMKYYHQSYDVRDAPYLINRFKTDAAFTRALCEVVGENCIERKFGPEFLSCEDAYQYFLTHSKLQKDPEISLLMKKIDGL